jgi:hypothetical protein
MKLRNLFFAFLLMPFWAIFSQEDTPLNFPDDFFGIYTGSLEIHSPRGNQSLEMEFHLKPTDTLGKYQYTLVYTVEGDRQERRYYLLEKNKETGEYVVDEGNGIVLHDKVIENKMYALFEVGDNLLTTFITFEKTQMIFEIAVTNTTQKQITYVNNEEKTRVTSYPISTVQRAVLQKQ